MEDQNNNKVMLDAGVALAGVQKVVPSGQSAPFIVVPEGYGIHVPPMGQVEAWLDKPLRKKGTFHFADVESFIRYTNEQKNPDSRLFADINDHGAVFSAKLNFHGAEPSFNDHIALMELEPTHEWKVWSGHNDKHMSQVEFAAFLEENSDMFTAPSGASLLELVQTLEGKSDVAINSAVKLQNGTIKLAYTEEVVLRGVATGQPGEMEIPPILTVSIAPFVGTARYSLKARLRYRIESKKIVFWYKTVAAHEVVRAVCADLLTVIEKQTQIQPFKI